MADNLTAAELAAKRINPTGKTSEQMAREAAVRAAEKASTKKMPEGSAVPDQREAVMQTAEQNKGYEQATGVKKRKGGTVKMAKGGSASSRADGIAQRGKTRGRYL